MNEETQTITDADEDTARRKAKALEANGWSTKSCYINVNGFWVITMRRFLKPPKKSKKD